MIELQKEIDAKAVAPRITPADIEANVVSEADGWTLMTLLKLVRDQKELPHLDSLVDAVAYAALRAECRAKEAE